MESCAGSHDIARKADAMGHDAVLLPAQFVRPYTKGQKNDNSDAEAIAEAAIRPTMPTVSIKDATQQEIQFLHRTRQGWIKQRMETANRVRAMLLEFGITVPQRILNPRRATPGGVRQLVADHWQQLQDLDEKIADITQRVERIPVRDARAARLMSIPGIGPMVATAMVAAVGDGTQFTQGRGLSAWLGLVPQQFTTGGVNRGCWGSASEAIGTCARC